MIVLSNVDTICAELRDVGMPIPLEWFYINIVDNLPKRYSVVRNRLQGNQKALTREIMMTELCNHHAFLDYNAHKPGAVALALYADDDSHRDGRSASGEKKGRGGAGGGRGRKSGKGTSGKRGNGSCGNSNGGKGNSSHAEAAKASGVICSACEGVGHVRAKCPTRVCEQWVARVT